MDYRFTVVFEKDEVGRIVAICPASQGCYSDGETLDEARANIAEAISLYVQCRLEHGELISEEVAAEPISVAI